MKRSTYLCVCCEPGRTQSLRVKLSNAGSPPPMVAVFGERGLATTRAVILDRAAPVADVPTDGPRLQVYASTSGSYTLECVCWRDTAGAVHPCTRAAKR